MSYEFMSNIKDVLVAGMDEFVDYEEERSNLGIGIKGWVDAQRYSNENNMEYFGAILSSGGSAPTGSAFNRMEFEWRFIIFMFKRWKNTDDMDLIYMNTALSAVETIAAGRLSINPTGHIKITDLLPMEGVVEIEDIAHVAVVFSVVIRKDY